MFRLLFQYRVFTVSNLLTFSRIVLTPFFAYYIALSRQQPQALKTALLLGAVMVATDFLDGFLARLLGQETPLGQYLDPIADKISSLVTLFFLYWYKGYPLWLLILILLREAAGTFGGIWILVKRKILAKPNYWGKAGVFFIAVSAVFYLVESDYKKWSLLPVVITLIGGVIAYSKKYFRAAFFPAKQNSSLRQNSPPGPRLKK